jgi:hypothetical protein
LLGVQLPPAVQETQEPALQTLLVPHDVPSAALPEVTQTELPVEQDVTPVLHWLVGWQLRPAVQEMQEPPLQTLLVPHDVPSVTFPVSVQTEVPLMQEVAPVLQTLVGWQPTLAVQLPQVPLSHTLFVPQEVPLATFPVSVQTEVPVMQEVAPVLQTLVGWQLTLAVQLPQVPLSHTLFVPQEVPLVRFCPVSEQVIAGEQAVRPAWQMLDGMQLCPAVQETQLPLLQTMFVPQEVPFATFPDCVQTGAPLLQTVVPVRHGAPEGEQLAPAWQLTQLPVLPQTLLVPQLVPAETSFPVSLQTGVPVEQASVPWWQGLLGTQLAPSWQATHWPDRQTIPLPQEVPFGWSSAAVQSGVPVAQLMAPSRQGWPESEQALPAAHERQAPALQTRFVPQAVPFAWSCCVSVQVATPSEQAV